MWWKQENRGEPSGLPVTGQVTLSTVFRFFVIRLQEQRVPKTHSVET